MTPKTLKSLTQSTIAFVAIAGISACESPEQTTKRQNQFNGMPLSSVEEAIGPAANSNAVQAVWSYENTRTVREPIQSYINGNWVTKGYRNKIVNDACIYTATLNAGIVVSSAYEGNSCLRFAPKL